MTTLQELMTLSGKELHQILLAGHPLDPDQLAGNQYLGVDLSLPGFARKLLWHTFRKAFHRDGDRVRGWNVRVEQTGIDGPTVPMMRKDQPTTFGHFEVTKTGDVSFPKGYRGAHFLDYGNAGNTWVDPAALGYTPLVAVNDGSQELLLGWEIFKVGPLMLPLPLYWALRLEGRLDTIVDPPRPVRRSLPTPPETASR